MKAVQILVNLVLYAFLVYLLYKFTIAEWHPWDAFVVAFVLVVSIVITFIPWLHAKTVSPGEYPYED